MEVKTYTVREDSTTRCAKCGGKFRKDQRMTIRLGEGFVEYKHFECPVAPKSDPDKMFIQGSR